MKINYKNTALGLLTDMNVHAFRLVDDGGVTTQQEKTRLGVSLVNGWHHVRDVFASNIRFISKSFYDAYEKALPKLANILDSEPMRESGTIMFSVQPGEVNTIFYDLAVTGKDADFKIECIIMVFTKCADKDKPALAMLVQRLPNGGVKEYISKRAKELGTTDMTIVADIITLLLFIKHCDVETNVTEPKNRRAKVAGQKYLNETDKRIQILDCTWFTNLVVSGSFGVSGHLHWYYYGPGKKQKKLIWVDEYTKKGYQRNAKIITQNEERQQ